MISQFAPYIMVNIVNCSDRANKDHAQYKDALAAAWALVQAQDFYSQLDPEVDTVDLGGGIQE